MGEKQKDNLENNDPNNSPQSQENGTDDQVEDVNEDDMDPAEYQRLDNQLDALFTALDDIESKNDNIHAQLLELLQANREIRKQLKEENQNDKPEDMETENAEKS